MLPLDCRPRLHIVHNVNHSRKRGQQPRILVPLNYQLELVVHVLEEVILGRLLVDPCTVHPLDQLSTRGHIPILLLLGVPDSVLPVIVGPQRVILQLVLLFEPAVDPPLLLEPQHALAPEVLHDGEEYLVVATPPQGAGLVPLHNAESIPELEWVDRCLRPAQVVQYVTVLLHGHAGMGGPEVSDELQGGVEIDDGDGLAGLGVKTGLEVQHILVVLP
mmetsp:Transcript_74909/g.171695  ORF Transcript_74909/g.171695 Transcript_74909/m.171695 type:complete len:218 (-) Transcript_74909:141-794(-)